MQRELAACATEWYWTVWDSEYVVHCHEGTYLRGPQVPALMEAGLRILGEMSPGGITQCVTEHQQLYTQRVNRETLEAAGNDMDDIRYGHGDKIHQGFPHPF